MDASATYIGVDKLGYFSKHVAPSYLIQLTGTALVMYPLKLVIFIGVIYLLDTQFEDDITILEHENVNQDDPFDSWACSCN